MEQEYTATNQSGAFDQALSLPHFDEEATLLSARPVVPLHEVNAETRSKRRMIFGLPILAAVLVGAIGTTLLLMQTGQESSGDTEAQLSQPVDSSSDASGGSEPNPVESKAQLPMVGVDKPTTKERQRSRASAFDSGQPAMTSRSSTESAKVEERDENREADEWEWRRAERREARRLNRDARRERRQRRERTGDDLLRIREIFEGSPRP